MKTSQQYKATTLMNLKSIMLTERKKATHCMILLIGLYGIGKAVISKGGSRGRRGPGNMIHWEQSD